MFLFEREWREGQREKETEDLKGLHTERGQPKVGFKLTNHEIMTWATVRCLTDWATQVPHNAHILNKKLENKIIDLNTSTQVDLHYYVVFLKIGL